MKQAPTGAFLTEGSRKLDALIDARKLTLEGTAEQIGVSRVAVHGWRHGQVRPGALHQAKIAAWSREVDAHTGELGPPTIRIQDWLLPEEQAQVDRIGQCRAGEAS